MPLARPLTGVVTGKLDTKTCFADSDLVGKAYHFVAFDVTDDEIVNLAETQALPPYILLDDGEVAGTATAPVEVSIVVAGRTKLKISETVAAGKFLVPGTGGLGEVGDAAGERYGAVALENGSANDIISVLVVQGELEASDA